MRNLLAMMAIAMIGATSIFNVSNVSAANSHGPDPSVDQQEAVGIFTFKQLGYLEKIMVGPYESTRIPFSIPPTWQLTSGGTITLKFNASFGGAAPSSATIGGTLLVGFNGTILDTIVLDH